MVKVFWTSLALACLFLIISSIVSINSAGFTRPFFVYRPGYSELFSFANLLLYLVLIVVVLTLASEKFDRRKKPGYLPAFVAICFAILIVPVRIKTHNLLVNDTFYFAFIIFFSSILFYCFVRNLLGADKNPSYKEMIAVAGILLLGLWYYDAANSPSVRMKKAVAAGNHRRFRALSQRYQLHLLMHAQLLNTALEKPDFEMIKLIVETGNTSFFPSYRTREMFRPRYLEILKYMASKGVNLGSSDVLLSAIEFYAGRSFSHHEKNESDSKYAVLSFLLEQYQIAKEKNSAGSTSLVSRSFSNPLNIAAASGDVELMKFLLDNGFKIDEGVYSRLVRNGYIERPEIKALVSSFKLEVSEGTLHGSVDEEQESLAVADALLVSKSDAVEDKDDSETKPDSVPRLRKAKSGIDLVIDSGVELRWFRQQDDNIFHFLASSWQSVWDPLRSDTSAERHYDGRRVYKELDYDGIFNKALARKIDLEHKNRSGLTPLWVALYKNNFRAFLKLIEAGADQNALNPEGQSLREYCLENNRLILMSLLDDQGAVHNEE